MGCRWFTSSQSGISCPNMGSSHHYLPSRHHNHHHYLSSRHYHHYHLYLSSHHHHPNLYHLTSPCPSSAAQNMGSSSYDYHHLNASYSSSFYFEESEYASVARIWGAPALSSTIISSSSMCTDCTQCGGCQDERHFLLKGLFDYC